MDKSPRKADDVSETYTYRFETIYLEKDMVER